MVYTQSMAPVRGKIIFSLTVFIITFDSGKPFSPNAVPFIGAWNEKDRTYFVRVCDWAESAILGEGEVKVIFLLV